MSQPAPAYSDLPEQMRAARRWLLWREEPSVGDKKPRKVPYYVSGSQRHGQLDGAEDLGRLATFDEAVKALGPRYAGLGFALGPDGTGNCWQGVDLDNLAEHPELDHIVEDLPGYTETSPSGRGLHAIGYGRPFQALGSNGSGIEAYSAGRYFTVTAEGAGLGEPTDLANWINAALRPLHAVRPVASASVAAVHEHVPAATVAELRSALLAMRADDYGTWIANGQRLKRLGDQGRALWLEWSATSAKFDPADAAARWDTFDGGSTGYAAIFAAAQARGWLNPLSNAAGQGTHAPAAPPAALALPCFSEAELEAAATPHPHAFMDGERGLFPEGEVTVLASPGREGKTTLVLAVATHYALGLPLAGMVPAACSPVLIYSAEDDRAQYARKTAAQHTRLPTEDRARLRAHILVPDLHTEQLEHARDIVRMDGRVPRAGPAVESLIQAITSQPERPGLVIFETASTLSDAEEDNAGHRAIVLAIKRIAKRTGTACVLVHHTSQNAGTKLPELDISEADIRGGTTLVNNARQTHLVVNLGSNADPFPETDARTTLRALVAPSISERVTALICLSSSKCADPAPLFFRWEDTRFGPRMVALDVPSAVRGRSWRAVRALLSGARAEARADKKAEQGQASVRLVVKAAAELAERGEQPTARQVSIACGRSFTWAKPFLEAAVEMGELVRSTEPVPRAKGLQDVYRPTPDGVPWRD